MKYISTYLPLWTYPWRLRHRSYHIMWCMNSVARHSRSTSFKTSFIFHPFPMPCSPNVMASVFLFRRNYTTRSLSRKERELRHVRHAILSNRCLCFVQCKYVNRRGQKYMLEGVFSATCQRIFLVILGRFFFKGSIVGTDRNVINGIH